jgi:hypothetical protein
VRDAQLAPHGIEGDQYQRVMLEFRWLNRGVLGHEVWGY